MPIAVNFKEQAPIRGALHLRIKRRGKIIEDWEDQNLVVDAGRNIMARLVGGETGLAINRIAFGTAGDDPAPGDTMANIANAFIKPVAAVSHPLPTQTKFDFVLLESEANGLAIRQFALVTANGTLFAHRTRGGKTIDKDSDLSIEGQWTIFF
jgi:hypothetical protein